MHQYLIVNIHIVINEQYNFIYFHVHIYFNVFIQNQFDGHKRMLVFLHTYANVRYF